MNQTINSEIGEHQCQVFESSTETASVRLSSGVRKLTGFESDSESEEEQSSCECKTDQNADLHGNDKQETTSVSNTQNMLPSAKTENDLISSFIPAVKNELRSPDGENTSLCVENKANDSASIKTKSTIKNDSRLLTAVSDNKGDFETIANNNEETRNCLNNIQRPDEEEEYFIHVDDASNTPIDINKIVKTKTKKNSQENPENLNPSGFRKRRNAFCRKISEVTVIHGNKAPSPENYGSQFEYHDRQGVKVSNVSNEDNVTSSSNSPSPSNVRNERECSPVKSQFRQERFNPFDKDIYMEEDHFSESAENIFKTQQATSTDSNQSPGSVSTDTWTDIGSHKLSGVSDFDDITNADLGLAEDHFSQPDGHFGLSSTEELDLAIENCVEIIKMVPQNSDKQKNLVQKLVQLRLKRQELKEGPEPTVPDVKIVVGHKFRERNSRSSKHYCEKCNAVIWGVLQAWYRCIECGYCCHAKCLISITRTCARVKVKENPTYCLSICPRKGLAAQNFRCAECKSPISFRSGSSEPRLCDYTGNYYCELCHWNDLMVIPARVLHNWDFETRKVCRASKQFLRLMLPKASIRIQDINPMLFNFVEELNEIKKLREELLVMKKYLLLCADAMKNKFLLLVKPRQHFIDSSDIYSMQDLLDVQTDVLLPELASVHSVWAKHIKTECQLCRGQGFICELCDDKEVLFPFDNVAVVCSQCSNVMHRHCFADKDGSCPRCERRDRRKGN